MDNDTKTSMAQYDKTEVFFLFLEALNVFANFVTYKKQEKNIVRKNTINFFFLFNFKVC